MLLKFFSIKVQLFFEKIFKLGLKLISKRNFCYFYNIGRVQNYMDLKISWLKCMFEVPRRHHKPLSWDHKKVCTKRLLFFPLLQVPNTIHMCVLWIKHKEHRKKCQQQSLIPGPKATSRLAFFFVKVEKSRGRREDGKNWKKLSVFGKWTAIYVLAANKLFLNGQFVGLLGDKRGFWTMRNAMHHKVFTF